MKQDRLLRVLRRQTVDRFPMWFMRQAGRYLPEYRQLRAQVPDFLSFCQTPDLATEAALQPLRRYPLDAAILFSDILVVPAAMGLDLQFVADVGPCFAHPVRTERDIISLPTIEPERDLAYVLEALRNTKRELINQVPVLGFAGSPWTLACYMIEGRASKNFQQVKRFAYEEPKLLHLLLQKLTDATIKYLGAQIQQGADALMLFDSWGGLLAEDAFTEFSLPYQHQIIAHLPPTTPVILFVKNKGQQLSQLAATGCAGLGLDWGACVPQAIKEVGHQVALQGNLDPALLFAPPSRIKSSVQQLLTQVGEFPDFIFNLGHGILPETSPDKLSWLIECMITEQDTCNGAHDNRCLY